MAYAEKRGNLWRARWRTPGGTLESRTGFTSRKDAENFGRDQEAAVRNSTYVDSRAGRITLTEWVNQWFPALDLELTTLSNYKYLIEVHVLPEFGDRSLTSLTAEEISVWERRLVEGGYSKRTAKDARSVLTTVLGDAIPRHLQMNPAQRRTGKGRKGIRRIERHERAEKAWPTPLQALLVAERCAALSGQDTDFTMVVHLAYTGSRWSEVIGLTPECVLGDRVALDWKLYELNGRFYRGRPKDGSVRPIDLPPFLAQLLGDHLANGGGRTCTCRNTVSPWCAGARYVFLGPGQGHFRRSNYSERFFRPAADGWYLPRGGQSSRPALPVLVTDSELFPGRPVPPWPAAIPGEDFVPPTGVATSGWSATNAPVGVPTAAWHGPAGPTGR
jgi:integrase